MIQLNELRVGNYISALGKITTQVEGFCIWDGLIQNSDFAERDVEDFDEIRITEKWLIDFGFNKCFETCFELNGFILNEDFILMDIDITIKLDYVHQLQNLYFALTTKELKL
jgi:hypothetical protein